MRLASRLVLVGCLTITAAGPVAAQGLNRDSLAAIGVRPPPHAALPSGLRFRDPSGLPRSLAGGGDPTPRVLVFADYACATLCGPALAIVAARLAETGLRAGADYRLEVAGLDPASTPAETVAFGRLHAAGGDMLVGDAASIAAATSALGYRYVYDPASHSFAHPVAAFVLTPDGRLSRALSEVTLTPAALKSALKEAKRGAAPGLVEVLAIACHGALQSIGRFDGGVLLGLRLGALATVGAGAVALCMLARRRPGQTS